MVSMISEGGRFSHDSRTFTKSQLLLPSLFPLGEIFFAVLSVLLVVSKFVAFHLPVSLRLKHVCLQVTWLKVNSWGRKYFELSVLFLGRGFLIRDNEHGFEKSGHCLLSVWALDFTHMSWWCWHCKARYCTLFTHSRQFPASCVLKCMFLSHKVKIFVFNPFILERGMAAGPAFTVFSKPANSLQQVVHFNSLYESGSRNLSNFILMWWEPQIALVTAPSKLQLAGEGKNTSLNCQHKVLLYAFLLLLTALLFGSDF